MKFASGKKKKKTVYGSPILPRSYKKKEKCSQNTDFVCQNIDTLHQVIILRCKVSILRRFLTIYRHKVAIQSHKVNSLSHQVNILRNFKKNVKHKLMMHLFTSLQKTGNILPFTLFTNLCEKRCFFKPTAMQPTG